ncbi:hypothetical protein PR048_013978 [Dryococelus australis]|uniref:Uncharacterized protein n=1 Tax=Dryococelus australis TaxID=614101 RepID=A0ABQ9HTN8_9NEOP|nr:hypothetical protein PR048_013978 [Dryococelus australis]
MYKARMELEDGDEEERFAAVVRPSHLPVSQAGTGNDSVKYVPPPKRKGAQSGRIVQSSSPPQPSPPPSSATAQQKSSPPVVKSYSSTVSSSGYHHPPAFAMASPQMSPSQVPAAPANQVEVTHANQPPRASPCPAQPTQHMPLEPSVNGAEHPQLRSGEFSIWVCSYPSNIE